MKSKNSLELTLAILKPHAVKSPFVLQKIRHLIIENDFKIVRSRRTVITRQDANLFYADHREKFFFNRLITFMCSGPSDIHILARESAIMRWRELMGPTKVYQAQFTAPDTIRGMYGLSDTRNATHGSDSPASAEQEIKIFFKDFNAKKWFEDDEIFFKLGRIQFDATSFVHKIDQSLRLGEVAEKLRPD